MAQTCGDVRSRAEAAEFFGIAPERVAQIERKVLGVLRHPVEDGPPG